MKTAAIALAAACWAVACAARLPGPPEIVLDRSACSHCGMLISERIYAAAFRAPDGREQVFVDIGCLLAVVRKQSLTNATFWFHDGRSGAWIDGTSAVFVASPSFRTPMAGGVLAFATRVTADQAAEPIHASVIPSLTALLPKGGAQ